MLPDISAATTRNGGDRANHGFNMYGKRGMAVKGT